MIPEQYSHFYEQEVVAFDEEAHAYTYQGRRIPSVTTVLKKIMPVFKEEYWSRYKVIQKNVLNIKGDCYRYVPENFYQVEGIL
jgi:hypothetical protein